MSLDASIFLNIFQDKQDKSKKRLLDYVNDPNEKQIHDLRISIRKLETIYLILPNSAKTKETKKFVSSYKSFFKKNSSIRDYDIIIKKLLTYGLTENSISFKFLNKQKEKKIKNIIKNAKKLSKLETSKIKDVSHKKILKKYERIIFNLIEEIENYIPIVTSDESKIEELHSMRKTLKKLRYILEVIPSDSYKNIINNMKSFQEFLGQIHDCDLTINFLNKKSTKFPELRLFITQEQSIRTQIYTKLANSLFESINKKN